MNPRNVLSHPRLDDLISWFAASVVVTVGVVYGLKLQDDRRKAILDWNARTLEKYRVTTRR